MSDKTKDNMNIDESELPISQVSAEERARRRARLRKAMMAISDCIKKQGFSKEELDDLKKI